MLNEVAPIRAQAPKTHLPPKTWKDEGACISVGTDLFFPEEEDGPAQVRTVQQVCHECPVAVECRAAGMLEEYGIWGGLTAKERKRIRRHVPEWWDHARTEVMGDSREAMRLRKLVRTAESTADIIEGLPVNVRTQPFVLDMRVHEWIPGR